MVDTDTSWSTTFLISLLDDLRKDTSIGTRARSINDSLYSCHDLFNGISQREND
jgi:hypothetical protein